MKKSLILLLILLFPLTAIAASMVMVSGVVVKSGTVVNPSPYVKYFVDNNGLVNWYRFDEGTGSTTIDSFSSDNGTWAGSTTAGSYYTTGIVGAFAGTFNGVNNHVATFTIPLSPFSVTARSVCAWINTATTTREGIIGTRNPSGLGGFGFNIGAGGAKTMQYYISGGSSLVTGAVIATSTFYDICVTQSVPLTTAIIYVNGVISASSTSFTSNETTSSYGGIIGDETGLANHEFMGTLDDVRIYNRAISTTEVANIYNYEKAYYQ